MPVEDEDQRNARLEGARLLAKERRDARRALREFAAEHGLPDPFRCVRARGHDRRERLDSWTAYAVAFSNLLGDGLPYSAPDVWECESDLRSAAAALEGDPLAKQIDDAVRRILRTDRERHESALRERWLETEREAGRGRHAVKRLVYVAFLALLVVLLVSSFSR